VKLPRDISGEEAVKALRRLGFEVVRQEGSHIRMSDGIFGTLNHLQHRVQAHLPETGGKLWNT